MKSIAGRGRIQFLLILISVCVLTTASVAHAADSMLDIDQSGDVSDLFNKIFSYAISIGAIAAVLRIAYAGYLYMGQSDMWSHKGQAKQILSDVTLGLVLLLSIWIILNQINPHILEFNILKKVSPPSTIRTSERPDGLTGETSDSLQQYDAIRGLQEESFENPTDTNISWSQTPLPGYYCIPPGGIRNDAASQNNYACLTSQTNCEKIAQPGGSSCTYTSNSAQVTQCPNGASGVDCKLYTPTGPSEGKFCAYSELDGTISAGVIRNQKCTQVSSSYGTFYSANRSALWCYQAQQNTPSGLNYFCIESEDECNFRAKIDGKTCSFN